MKQIVALTLAILTSCGHTAPKSGTILIIGDSIVATSGQQDTQGWGEHLQRYLPAYTVTNGAIAGKSSKSYWDKYWAGAYTVTKPDIVFLQFGHNDSKPEAFRHTDPATTYKDYLRSYITAVRADKGTLILITPPERTEHTGCISDRILEPYVQAMREVAESDGVQLIDIWTTSVERLEADCFGDSMKFYADKAHLTKAGAKFFAKLIAKDFLK